MEEIKCNHICKIKNDKLLKKYIKTIKKLNKKIHKKEIKITSGLRR